MTECRHCRQAVSATARYCEHCGGPLADDGVSTEISRRIQALMARGEKIEAIRVLREATGLGLAEAKHWVESAIHPSVPPDSSNVDRELLTLLESNQKIEAIKRLRERTQMGLKEAKDYVEALAARHGRITKQTTGCMTVILVGISLVLGTASIFAADPPAKPAAEAWQIHRLNSAAQADATQIRVLIPDRIEAGKRLPVLYVLPVEAKLENHYGDGLTEIRRHDIHNKYGLICVAPTFSHLPWYADHPTDQSIRQETYFVKDVVPLVDRLYATQANRDGRWLLGFSKSGWGAWSLLVRHPDLFGRAAAWDAPLEMHRYDLYGAGQVFGTQTHFDTYRVLPALKQSDALLQSPTRLVLTGYDNFRSQHETAHGKLDEWKIPHVYRDGPQRKHVWDSGWVPEAVELLAGLKPTIK